MLKRKKSQYNPPYPSRWSVGPGGQLDQEHGVVLHVLGEGYQSPITSRTGSTQYLQVNFAIFGFGGSGGGIKFVILF